MDEWLARLLTVTYPTVIVCATALFGYWLKLRHERRMLEEGRGQDDRILEELEALRQEHLTQLAEMQERLDFTERLLTQRGLQAPSEPKATAPV
jgi:hypothetical protein